MVIRCRDLRASLAQSTLGSRKIAAHTICHPLCQAQAERGQTPQERRILRKFLECLLSKRDCSLSVIFIECLYYQHEIEICPCFRPFHLLRLYWMLLQAVLKLCNGLLE